MKAKRLPLDQPHHPPQTFEFLFDGQQIAARAGETVATALLAAGVGEFRRDQAGRPRGPYCNMGSCYECRVAVAGDSAPWRRACQLMAAPDMVVTSIDMPEALGG